MTTGVLIEIWLNYPCGPKHTDHYSVEAGDSIVELPDRRVSLGKGFVADTTTIIQRRYIQGEARPQLVCARCGESFATGQALGSHRKFCKDKGSA